MMRLPRFRFVAPECLAEAADVLAAASPGDAAIVAGGTDLIPNMKRRQQTPGTLIGLRRIGELRAIHDGRSARQSSLTGTSVPGMTIGAGVTLTHLIHALSAAGRPGLEGLRQAAAQIATPHLRNMGTLGGNLCLDTRCNYYDQNYEWRKAIDFCMKKDGKICWVATSSPRCLAVSSTDTAPALMSLGALVTLASAEGARTVPLGAIYRNDGIDYLSRRPTEILTAVLLPALHGWRSTYWKLRRRGSFDFPVLSVAAAVKVRADGSVEEARIVLGAVASCPVEAPEAARHLRGEALSDDQIAGAAEHASRPARPMDNTDFGLVWRKRMARTLVTYALRELRGDDMRAERYRIARQLL
jgi:4-hydroxybenzoyl-CoA reductase subunit beta